MTYDSNDGQHSCGDPARYARTLRPGMHLVTARRGYVHHGIYAGDGHVVHYAGFKGWLRRGPVERITLAEFAGGHGLAVSAAPQARYHGDEVVARALSRLGEDRYRLLSNNCEHFCTWCLFDISYSEQVRALPRHPWRGVHVLGSLLASALVGALVSPLVSVPRRGMHVLAALARPVQA